MTASYLKRHYLNDAKLAQRALLEFHRALSSGRLIAFTGSMTTQPCGYGTWAELIDAYGRLADIALDIAEPNDIWERMLQELRGGNGTSGEAKNRTIERFRRFLADDTTRRVKIDPRVALSLFEEVLLRPDAERAEVVKQWGDWELDQIREPIDLLSIGIARYFRRPYRQCTEGSAQDVLSALIDDVGVRRIATLNYDLELEGRLMLADQVLEADEFPFDRLRRLRASGNRDLFDWDLSSGRIRRVMPNGHAVESDILNRERIDRMLEFAIGADDVDYHILHLHGRACSAESMILSYRDYDQLYRRQGLSKLPFEFAQRILMGGNPVLFVGMGMSEAEINQALQDFVSSSPYQRVAPTFLLWNAEDVDWENAHGVSGAEMRRLDWLHRLGVLTIFDTDLTREDVRSEDPVPARLARLLRELPKRAALVGGREEYTGGQAWRQMVKAQDLDGPVLVWEVADTSRDVGCCKRAVDAHVLRKLTDRIRQESAVGGFGIVARQGCGKGSLAWRLAFRSDALDIKPENVILINASFSFDTDSVLDAIARFFDARTNWRYTGGAGGTPKMSRSAFFRSMKHLNGSPMLVIVNGCERFFSVRGKLLSAELHELFWLCAKGHLPFVRLVLVGTSRTRAYIEQTLGFPVIDTSEIGLESSWNEEMLPVYRFAAIRGAFEAHGISAEAIAPGLQRRLDRVVQAVRATAAARISGDLAELRKAFFDLYLNPKVLEKALGGQLALANEVLRALAFIGLPAEEIVLAHVPRLRNLVRTRPTELTGVLARLEELGLVLRIVGHRGRDGAAAAACRYSLPRLLLTELRARFSVPLSEAKLSTAYNMSLYVAQPVDGYIPEPEIHDELGNMVDHLLGAYRDLAVDRPDLQHADQEADLLKIAVELMPQEDRAIKHDSEPHRNLARELETLASAESMQCFRAALSLIRGYYTTTDLLTLDVGDRLVREERDPVLLEHAERLDSLIDAYGKIALARERLSKGFGKNFHKTFGSFEPLYPDELVWLHNERGVIRLAMGDLYEAGASFLRALNINRLYVEREDRSHNWRRIRLNQLTVDIEGGATELAQRKIEEILQVSQGADAIDSDEDRLAAALATGYRGWAHQLQGSAHAAGEDYATAIKGLRALDESRATVYIQRMQLTLASGEEGAIAANGPQVLDRVMDLALATRQMDLVYRLRVLRAMRQVEDEASDAATRKQARQQLEDAQAYALQTALNRVRVEAGIGMAEARFRSGDFEGALRAVSDAMMVATRFGLELRKIVLRSIMARIMAERGHPITALNLAGAAIRIGSRLRYAQAIRNAEQTLAAIPHISAVTDVPHPAMPRSR